jgi:T4 RnlA family RNA ligase
LKYQLDILNHYIEKGLVVKQDHPTLPLSIYNYSRTCQYERLWDDVTMDCRGLVLDSEGNVIAKPFRKFFNMEEHKPEEIPNEPFEVFEKMDGSLGILFNYKGEWILSTKGSFNSDQAIKGMEIAKRYNYDKICIPGFVYLFEIIYPENRIVVNYGTDERLVLLSIVNPEGKELDYDEIEIDGWDIVNRYDGIRDYSELKSKISQNDEGFVIRFRSGFRMKIKGDEYVRLHRILTGFSNITIWEYLKDKRDFNEFLDRVPDEFDSWVRNTVEDIKNEYEMINSEYKWIFQVLMRSSQSETKKGFAEMAKKYKHPSILFKMFDGKEYSNYIWKQIRPNYQKPFRKELEN